MRSRQTGLTAAETLVVVALVGLMTVAALPAARMLRTHGRLTAAARELGLRVQAQRWRAVATNRAHGLWFVRDDERWSWFEVRDGNGNGLRTAELLAGVDVRLSGPHRIDDRFGGVRLGFPRVRPLVHVLPDRGWLRDDGDPIRFGRSDVVACTPLGRASSGTIYLTDGDREARAVVVFGPTARVRVWRYMPRTGRWRS